MSTVSQVSVHYRHVELQSSASLHENSDGGLFVELADPPPVRTVLELRKLPDGANVRAYEITAVVEVEAAGASRGCALREVDSAALTSRAVGSERLADASAGSAPIGPATAAVRAQTDERDESWSDDYGAHMAVPAPVVVDGDGAEDSEESDVNADDSGDASDESADGNASASESDASRSTSSGKKRRGRRRK